MAGESYYGAHQTVELPSGGPSAVNDATQRNPLGTRIRWKGNTYRYVLHDAGTGSVATAAKYPAIWKTLDPDGSPPVFTVTADWTDTLFGKGGVAGVYLGVITDAYYCWIQCGGLALGVVPGAIEGDMVIGSATDGEFTKIASGSNLTEKCYGVVSGGSTASGAPILLQNMDW